MKFVVNSYKVFIDSNPSLISDDFFFYELKVPSLYLHDCAVGIRKLHSEDLIQNGNLIQPSL